MPALWKAARKTRTVKRAAELLAGSTGPRERCMYCADSHGTDIDHYRPKAKYSGFVFCWGNWLWLCAGCNRSKQDQFPLDADGQPLLIDPTADEPWDYLFYESKTGEITARWHGDEEDAKACQTLAVLAPLRHQATCEGRQVAWRGLVRAVRYFLSDPEDTDAGPRIDELLSCIADSDDYGMAAWCFLRDGSDEVPFAHLRAERPLAWQRVKHQVVSRLEGVGTV